MAKTELAIIEAMTPEERELFFAEQALSTEQAWLEFMIDSMRQDDEYVEFFTDMAKQYYWHHEQYGDDLSLERAEQYIRMAKETKQHRYKLIDISNQRRRVQWQRTKLARIKRRHIANRV